MVSVKSPFFVLMDMLKKNVTQRKIDRKNEQTKSKDFIDIFLDTEVDASEVKFGADSDVRMSIWTKPMFLRLRRRGSYLQKRSLGSVSYSFAIT
ncbi:hypothetical protein PRIPAC_77315 [Pristionchus pacificus]|uniref:Uncharacterized protein n=1 Tax=Pristionchus pacificus TaxID=54126 RepID=A0A2A6CPK5_PRIPA|nr:hypothetical protein PRIPAC_77315 [Pristionchus pacificus]|eukprot:PDM79971.1 hypothetical protein PRIPAC_32550 [Pristionchus pacificus]